MTYVTTSRPGLALKELVPEDAEPMVDLVQANRDHLTQRGDYKELVEQSVATLREQLAEPESAVQTFGVLLNDELIGTVALIRYQPTVYGLGYWIDSAMEGQGYMKASVQAAIDFAYDQGATEVWAGITPTNKRSIELVKRLGFELARTQETHLSYRLILDEAAK